MTELLVNGWRDQGLGRRGISVEEASERTKIVN